MCAQNCTVLYHTAVQLSCKAAAAAAPHSDCCVSVKLFGLDTSLVDCHCKCDRPEGAAYKVVKVAANSPLFHPLAPVLAPGAEIVR